MNHTALARKNNPVEWLTISMNGCIAMLFLGRIRRSFLPPSNPEERKRLRHRTYNNGLAAEDW